MLAHVNCHCRVSTLRAVALVSVLLLAISAAAAQGGGIVPRVLLCEGATGCDEADLRLENDQTTATSATPSRWAT